MITSTDLYGNSGNMNAISGLMSGLDTESIVDQMLYSTKNKINAQYQKQQK